MTIDPAPPRGQRVPNANPAKLGPRPQPVPREVYLRRRVFVGGVGLALVTGLTQGVRALLPDQDPAPSYSDELAPDPVPGCVPEEGLVSRASIGSARLVYEVDQTATSMRFDPAFHARLEQWLDDWNATSRYANPDTGPSPRIVDTLVSDYAAVGSVAARRAS
ncbi:hypothetical protein ACTQ49_13630 [Luteococcus sp. Sow4_B9]|uniref:hypothetical protein n=1 Tax=Luteococcus sp. Sow4_B9 TaxID=3438792 RepID=UPI003F9C7E57